ncbi:MAG: DNA polymerase III subunit gamma/tau [Saprospiraceae bacterium]|nr:DNA polymerase III subunit gamma/tau [Saprospiraceae bacterium]
MSNFIVSARKYRPQSFDDVIGQDHIARTLKNALQSGQLAHAFLFTGPRGVGKTTCARILAKVINCENPENKVTACNTCSSCTSFNDNASFNIFELDAASNNSVDDIRALTEQVRYAPQAGKYKVYIIDEVHMLSSAAFNAFLKTLEEPPAHAIFILATTEKHKIIPTILSRCQVFDFKRIQAADVVVQLEKICQKENIQAEKEALHMIATKADGAMRDALTIFDKIHSSSANGIITYKDVIANLNILDYDYFFRITDACLREDITEILLTLDEIIKLGFDPEIFVIGMAEHFRDLLIAKVPATLHILELSEELKIRYNNQALLAPTSFLLSGLNILNQCDIDLARAKNKRLQVELALTKLAYINKAIEVSIFDNSAAHEKKKLTV